MPTYHYRCKNCNYDFTEQQSFTDDPITVCPKCGEEQVRKVYSAPPIEFKIWFLSHRQVQVSENEYT